MVLCVTFGWKGRECSIGIGSGGAGYLYGRRIYFQP
jgi:hypothetical protein